MRCCQKLPRPRLKRFMSRDRILGFQDAASTGASTRFHSATSPMRYLEGLRRFGARRKRPAGTELFRCLAQGDWLMRRGPLGRFFVSRLSAYCDNSHVGGSRSPALTRVTNVRYAFLLYGFGTTPLLFVWLGGYGCVWLGWPIFLSFSASVVFSLHSSLACLWETKAGPRPIERRVGRGRR